MRLRLRVASSAFHSAPAPALQALGQADVCSQSPSQGQAQGAKGYKSGGKTVHFLWSVHQMNAQRSGYLQGPARGNLKRCKNTKAPFRLGRDSNSVALEQGMFFEDCSSELMARAFSSETWKPMKLVLPMPHGSRE